MNAYILIYTGSSVEREELVKILDHIPEIISWRYDMHSCFYILSQKSAREVGDAVATKYPTLTKYIITKIDGVVEKDYWGLLTAESWEMLEKKKVTKKYSDQNKG